MWRERSLNVIASQQRNGTEHQKRATPGARKSVSVNNVTQIIALNNNNYLIL